MVEYNIGRITSNKMTSKMKLNKFGDKEWHNKNGQYHREDGPAIEYANGSKEWWVNGIRHREDGPAIEYTDGFGFWHYHGKWIECQSQEEFERIIQLIPFE